LAIHTMPGPRVPPLLSRAGGVILYPFRLLGKLIRKEGPRRRRRATDWENWALKEIRNKHIRESDALSRLNVERVKLECEFKDGQSQLKNEMAQLEVKMTKLEHDFRVGAAAKDIEITTKENVVDDLQDKLDLAEEELFEGPGEDYLTPLVGVAAFVGVGYALGANTEAVAQALHEVAVRGLRSALWSLNGV